MIILKRVSVKNCNDQFPQISAGIPSNLNPASKEMISDSVEPCETEVCFSHIQLIGTNVWLPKMHNVPHGVDSESSGSPGKSEFWNSPNMHCLAMFPKQQYCLYSHVGWLYEIKRDNRLLQALVKFVIDRANLFTDHRISGLPIRAKYKHFRTILPRISILLLWNDCQQCMELMLCRVVESSCSPTHNVVRHNSWHDLPYRRTMKKYEDFPSTVIFQLLLRLFWVQTWFGHCQHYLCLFHIVFEYNTNFHDQRMMLVLPDRHLYWVLSISDQCFVSFQPIWYHPHTQKRKALCHGVRISIPSWKTSPNRTSKEFLK